MQQLDGLYLRTREAIPDRTSMTQVTLFGINNLTKAKYTGEPAPLNRMFLGLWLPRERSTSGWVEVMGSKRGGKTKARARKARDV